MKRLNFLLLFRFFIFLLITILSFYSCTDAQVILPSNIEIGAGKGDLVIKQPTPSGVKHAVWGAMAPPEIKQKVEKAKEDVTISEILSNPNKYHLKTVLVKGEVLAVKHKISRKGNPYTVFALSDGTSAIKIFTFGTPEINRGNRVKVKGIFYKVKYVGRYTFYNEIDATDGWIKRE